MRRRTLLAAMAALPALAHEYRAGDLVIDHPFTRATSRAGGAAGGFMTIRNTGTAPDRLLRAESDAAGAVELHTTLRDGDVMRMRPVEGIDLPPGQSVALAPGGLHVMLLDTRRRFDRGQRVTLTLVFQRAGRVEVELAVEAAGAGGGGHHHH